MLLQDEVADWAASRVPGLPHVLAIGGPPGSGKTTALCHLAAVLPQGTVDLIDDADGRLSQLDPHGLPLVLAIQAAPTSAEPAVLRLCPWDEDDVIEFLLAVRRDRCAPVMARVRAAGDWAALEGDPELCRIVLERMIADDAITEVQCARRPSGVPFR